MLLRTEAAAAVLLLLVEGGAAEEEGGAEMVVVGAGWAGRESLMPREATMLLARFMASALAWSSILLRYFVLWAGWRRRAV